MEKASWPAWRYGPGGACGIFQHPGDVPAGWADHPSKVAEGVVQDVRSRVDTNQDDYGSVREISEALAAGTVTLEEVEAAESKRSKPRQSVRKLVSQARKAPQRADPSDFASKEAAIQFLRAQNVEIADNASDEQVIEALRTL